MPLRENLSSAPLRAGIRGFPEDYADFGIMQTETSEPSECPGKLPNFDA